VGDACLGRTRYPICRCGDYASRGRERTHNPRLKLDREQMYREFSEIRADLRHVEGDRSHPSTAQWHRSPPSLVLNRPDEGLDGLNMILPPVHPKVHIMNA
jgi:hypothetical protein